MVRMISFDAFTCFYSLLVGLLFVATLCTRRHGRSLTCVDVRGVCRLPTRPHRVEDGLPQGLMGRNPGRTRSKGLDASVLEVYARQFEEAIERIRLRTMGPRRREGR